MRCFANPRPPSDVRFPPAGLTRCEPRVPATLARRNHLPPWGQLSALGNAAYHKQRGSRTLDGMKSAKSRASSKWLRLGESFGKPRGQRANGGSPETPGAMTPESAGLQLGKTRPGLRGAGPCMTRPGLCLRSTPTSGGRPPWPPAEGVELGLIVRFPGERRCRERTTRPG